MKIIPFQDKYKTECLAIFKSNVPKYFAEYEYDDFSKWIDTEQAKDYLLLEDNNELVGCGGTFIDDEKKECGFAWGMIHQDHHGKGYGTFLSEYRINVLKQNSRYPIRLCTSQHTKAFYERLGFETYSFKKNGFSEGLDRYDMRLTK